MGRLLHRRKAFRNGVVIDNDLILRLKFDEGSLNAIADSSGNGNHFTKSGGTWVTGKSGSGYALSFDGNFDYASSDAAINFGTDVITVAAWVKWDAFANDDSLLMELGNNFSQPGDFIIDPNDSAVTAWTAGIAGTGSLLEYASRPSAGVWVHVAVVFDNSTAGGDVKIYFDGVEQTTSLRTNTKTVSGNFRTTTLYLFSREGISLYGAGDMDDLRIYAGELTQGEIEHVRDNPDE